MDPKELRGLMEAYAEMYAPIDENRMASRMEKMPSAPAKVGKATHSIKDLSPSKPPTPEEKAKARKALGLGEAVKGESSERRRDLAAQRRAGDKPLSPAKGRDNANKMQRDINYFDKLTKKNNNEEVEIFDTVLEFLQAEGYAETLEEAEWLMANVIDEEAIDIILGEEQLDELSVNKMLAYVEKGEKNRADLNKKWDKGTATHRERMRVLGREEGEKRASDKVEKKTGKRPYQMNALDKVRYAVTKEDYMDEASVTDDRVRRNQKTFGSNYTPPRDWDQSANRGKGAVLNAKQKEKQRRKSLRQEEYMDEAQEARNNPEKYEREQSKKSAPVRGERTPMPPRGNKRREDFEKWYAANVR